MLGSPMTDLQAIYLTISGQYNLGGRGDFKVELSLKWPVSSKMVDCNSAGMSHFKHVK